MAEQPEKGQHRRRPKAKAAGPPMQLRRQLLSNILAESVRRYLRKCWHFQPSKRFRSGHDARKVWATLEEEVTALVPPDALASDAISVRVDAQ